MSRKNSGFNDDPILSSSGGRMFELIEPLTYTSLSGMTFTVPAGFTTDCATSRVWRWQLLDWDLAYGPEPVLHDYLYRTLVRKGKMGRAVADGLFLEAMRRCGRRRYDIYKAYFGVRIFGWIYL
jgi:hypothetical protein